MGLYAATIPTMIAALLRSSRLTVTGPTNAISLLVFIGVMALPSESALTVATTLAVMAGALQLILYLARLESLMSFVSQPVVIGYITGAAVLIGISAAAKHYPVHSRWGKHRDAGLLLGHQSQSDAYPFGFGWDRHHWSDTGAATVEQRYQRTCLLWS